MKKFAFPLFAALALVLSVASPSRAGSAEVALSQRLKNSYNTMVLDVREAPMASEKREILDGFLGRMDNALGIVETFLPASNPTRATAVEMRARLQADRGELDAFDLRDAQASGNLDAFASYIQQDVEQADGVYLSVGALIIILIVVIVLF